MSNNKGQQQPVSSHYYSMGETPPITSSQAPLPPQAMPIASPSYAPTSPYAPEYQAAAQGGGGGGSGATYLTSPPILAVPVEGSGAAYPSSSSSHQQSQQQQQPPPYDSYYTPPVPTGGPGHHQQPPQTIVQQSRIMVVEVDPRQSFQCQCPTCGNNVLTELSFVANAFTFMGCFGLMLLGCFPCCLIPFCINDCKTRVHTCPVCRNVIAVN